MYTVDAIIPAYNAERYLVECIESVINQTHRCSSIIIVDDASTDQTPIIGRELAQKYNDRVKYVRHLSNKGPNAARNTGIKASSSSFLAFLDSDDVWLTNKIDTQMALFANASALGMVGCGVYHVDEIGNIIGKSYGAVFNDRREIEDALMIRSIANGSASGVIIRRECFAKLGTFDENLRGAEDRDMWFRISKEYDMKNISEPLVKIRHHPYNAHLNISKMKANQKKFIEKHLINECLCKRQRAMSYIYLDAAREYYGMGKNMKTFINSLLAIIMYPKKISREDDKYRLIIKAILPNTLFRNT